MKVGTVRFRNRIAQVFDKLNKINNEADLISYSGPLLIQKTFAEKNNIYY